MLSTEQLMMVPRNMYSKNEVPEDETGLLFIDGRLARQLESGSYYFWNNMKKIICHNIDLRTQQMDISVGGWKLLGELREILSTR